jgi:hypothetical protein
MELKNISSFDEFKQKRVNEASIFSWVGGLLKKFGGALSKSFSKFEQSIKNEKDPKKIVNFLKIFLQEQQKQMQTQLKTVMSAQDVRNILVNTLESTYSAFNSIGEISDVGGKFKPEELFAAKKDLAAALSQPKEKAISDPSKNLVGSIANYVDTVLMPNLKSMSGVKESFVFEELGPTPAATTTGTPPVQTPVPTTPTTPTTPPAPTTPTTPTASGTTTPPTKEQLKPGAEVTYKNKQNQVVKGVVSSNQDGVSGTQINIDPLKEGYGFINEDVVDVASVTSVDKPAPTIQPPAIAQHATN